MSSSFYIIVSQDRMGCSNLAHIFQTIEEVERYIMESPLDKVRVYKVDYNSEKKVDITLTVDVK